MINISGKVVQKIKTRILCSKTFPENRAIYEIMWEKYGRARQATDDNVVGYLHFTCWIIKATDTHSAYVILLDFPLQQWLHESAYVLHYTYIAWAVTNIVGTKLLCPL